MPHQMASVHCALCFMLILAQCFGMLPVVGITEDNTNGLKFRWKAKRTIYSISFAIACALNTVFHIVRMIKSAELGFGLFVTLLFFAVTCLTVINFIDMGKKWPALMQKWANVDEAMISYKFPKGLHRKMKTICILVMTAAILEHALFIAFKSKNNKKGSTFIETINIYLENRFIHIFTIIPYNIVLGLLAQILNMFSTFSWNFMDLFIMLMSLSLSARFAQVHKKVRFLAKLKMIDVWSWRKVREDYTKLVNMSQVLDDAISNIILLSFTNNVFVIIVQIFNSIQPSNSKDAIDKIYFIYSFLFLLLRTIAVALYAATIDSESKKPRFVLTTLPQKIYNIEIERFLHQAKYNSVALTGHKLFKVRKSLIFRIAGAIVSYELILIQFHSETKSKKY